MIRRQLISQHSQNRKDQRAHHMNRNGGNGIFKL